ncbi:MAG: tetratricopeptide repeat protein [Brevinematia bacterium]
MPNVKKYNEGAIIYFDKDISDEVFLLKGGKVGIKYISEDTDEEVTKVVRPGEIFGLKSAIIMAPRGETAMAIEPSEVVVFSSKEFESFISTKPDVLFKTLKALSNQLRNIGIRVNNLLANSVTIINPDFGMFKIGEYFLVNKKYDQAIQVFERFIRYYPNSELAKEAKRRIEIAKKAQETGILSKFDILEENTTIKNNNGITADELEINGTVSSLMKALYTAENHLNRGNYEETLKIIEKLLAVEEISRLDMLEKTLLIKAKTLTKLKRYDEALEIYKEMIERFPNSKSTKIYMFQMASIMIERGDKNNAILILRKISAMPPFDEISQKAKEIIARL